MCRLPYPRYAMCGHPYRTAEERLPDTSSGAVPHAGWLREAYSTREGWLPCETQSWCDIYDCKWYARDVMAENEGWCPSCDTEYQLQGEDQPFARARELYRDLEVRKNGYIYGGLDKRSVEGRVKEVIDKFKTEANQGPFNHSYVVLETQHHAFVTEYDERLQAHRKKKQDQKKHAESQAQKEQQKRKEEAKRKEAEEREKHLMALRWLMEKHTMEKRLRAVLNLERDVTESLRLTSLTSRYNHA